MKTNYALAMTALLLLGLGGSVVGYRTAVNKVAAHEAHAKAPAEGGGEAAHTGEAASGAAGETTTATTDAASGTETTDATASEAGATPEAAADTEATAGASAAAAASDTAAGTAGAAGDSAAGGEKFAGTCGGCHGAQGQGGMGPAMTANAKNWDLAGFTTTLREGKTPDGRTLAPMMPHFTPDQLSDGDIANIHAWVQSL